MVIDVDYPNGPREISFVLINPEIKIEMASLRVRGGLPFVPRHTVPVTRPVSVVSTTI